MAVALRQAWSESQWTLGSINGICYYLNKCYTLSNTSQITFFSFRKTVHWCTSILRATQSNCCGALDFLSPELCRQQPRAERIDYKIQGVTQQREYESWVKKRLKKSSSDWLNSGNALIQYLNEKMRFSCFPVLPGTVVQKHTLIEVA